MRFSHFSYSSEQKHGSTSLYWQSRSCSSKGDQFFLNLYPREWVGREWEQLKLFYVPLVEKKRSSCVGKCMMTFDLKESVAVFTQRPRISTKLKARQPSSASLSPVSLPFYTVSRACRFKGDVTSVRFNSISITFLCQDKCPTSKPNS